MLELAQIEDREAVNRLARQVHAMHVIWRPDLYQMPDELYPEERFLSAVAKRQLYVAKVGQEIIGYAEMNIRELEGLGCVKRKVLLLEAICVDENFRRQGFGTQIMADVRALGLAFGCTDIQLGVYPQNGEAVAFYEKMGFFISSIAMQMKLR